MSRHRRPANPQEFADELDRRLTDLLRPAHTQVRVMLAFLDHLSREQGRDLRQELAVFWAGQNVEIQDTRARGIRRPRPTLHQELGGKDA